MTLRYLVDRRRKTWQKSYELINLGLIKDAVITQLESLPFWRLGEIKDIDFGEVTPEGKMKLVVYTSAKLTNTATKEKKSKTKKD